jgi:hypothetical protein
MLGAIGPPSYPANALEAAAKVRENRVQWVLKV